MTVSSVVPPPPPALKAPPRQYARTVDDQLRRAARQVKFVDLVGGLLTLLACSLVYLLLLAVVDHWIVGLNAPLRFMTFTGLLVGGGYYFLFRIGPLLFRRVNPEFAARAVEEVQPSLKNSLINFIQLRGERGAIREAVLFAIERRAAEDIAHISVETTIDRGKIVRLGCVLIAIFLVVAVYKIASPKDPFRSAARVLAPWARIDRPTRVHIESVAPGEAEVFLGNHLQVTVRLQGLAAGETPVLLYSTADEQIVERKIVLHRQSDASVLVEAVFAASAPGGEAGALQDFTYRVRAGDAESESYAVHTINAPTIRVERVAYEYPAYTKLPPRVVEGGELSAVEGTVAVIHARANQTIQSASLEFDAHVASNNLRASQRLKTSGRAATGRVRLLLKSDHKTPSHRSYQLRFRAASGHRNEHPLLHQMDITPDFSPEVEILQPQQAETDVPINGRQIIEVRGIDPDFGLREMNLHMVSGGRELVAKQLHFSPQGQAGAVMTRFVFRPQTHRLRVGDQVVFWAAAADNREDAQGSPAPNRAKTRNYRVRIVAADPTAADSQKSGRSHENAPEDSDAAETEAAQNGQKPGGEEQPQRDDKNRQDGNSKDNASDGGGDDAKKGDSKKSESASQDSTAQDSDSPSGENNQTQQPMEGEQGSAESGETGSQQGEPGAQGEPQKPGGEEGGGGEGMQGEAGDPNASAEQSGSGGKGGTSSAAQPQGDSQTGSQGSSGQSSGDSGQGNGNASSGKGGSGQEGGSKQSAGGKNDAQPGPNERLSPDGEQDGDVFEQLQKYMQDHPGDASSAGARKQPAGSEQSGAKESSDPTQASSQESSNNTESRNGDSETSDSKTSSPNAEQSGEKQNGEKQGGEGKAGSPDETSPQEQGGEKGGSQSGEKSGEKGSPQDSPREGKKSGSPGQAGEPQGRPGKKSSSENTEGASGAGKKAEQGEQAASGEQASKNQQGAPEAQEQASGKSKSGEGQPREDENGNEAQSPSGSKHESETQGATDGDRSGDGGKGGGQSGKRPGNDGAGSHTPGDTGAGAAQQPGQGETSSQGGQDKKADGATGRAGQEPGPGSRRSAAAGKQAGQGEPSKGSNDPASEQPQSRNSGRGAGQPGAGAGASGNQLPNDANRPPYKSTPAERDQVNLDYARRATDMALEMLENQKDKPDEKILDRLGWTKDDLAKFLRRWRSLQREARQDTPAGNAARQRLDDQLRGLGLRSDAAVERRSGRLKNDDFRDLSNEGYRSRPPASYLEQYEAFKRAAARLQTPRP